MSTPLFIQASLHDGPNAGTILIPYSDTLPLVPTSSRALILDQPVGVNVQGLYVYDSTQTWRYAMPIEAVSAIVVNGDQCDIYINTTQTYNLGPTTIVYRNGQLQTGHDVVPADVVYAVRTPNGAAQGAVTSVNGLIGDVVVDASNIDGFADVAYSGQYSDLLGAPDALVPATDTVLGGVMVPASSSITVDAQGNIDLKSAIVTKINDALTDVQTSGIGTSLIKTKVSGVVTLKSLEAGANVTLIDDGNGTLTVASQAGIQSVTLQGDVTGTGAGTITTALSATGVSAGTYKSVTVDAKGRVTAGTNPTTLAGFGINDALPLTGGSMSGSITMTAGSTIKGVPDPTNQTDAANKNYVDAQLAAAANGVSWRESVAAATTANLASLSGLLTIDGYVLQPGDRVLVKNQTTATQNGVYDASSGAWTRSSDSSTGAELFHAAYLVISGTTNGLTQWANTNTTEPTVGSTAITFGQLRAQGNTYTAGAGLTLTGQQFSISPTGVSAGTYAKVTVNTLGQVTGGSALISSDITTALGYTPYNGTTNPSGFIGALTAAGDATGSTVVTGSSGVLTLALAASGVTVGTYTSVTVDAKGRVTAGGQISQSQITTALGFTPVNKAGDTMTGSLNFATMVTIPSAATLAIGAATSNLISVSGTTTITAFDNAPGALRTLVFQGALTLTHNAIGGINLPGAANITTAAGDTATFFNVGGTNWRCLAYTRADGTSVKGSSGSPFSTVQIFNGSTTNLAAEFTNAVELARISTSPSGVTAFDVQLGAVQAYIGNTTSTNWTLNFRFNSTTTLTSMMTTGMTLTTAFVVAVSSVTGHYLTAVQIDGAAVPVKWQSGLAPSVGTAGGYDIYTFTLIKTSTGFLVFGSQTSYF
jgi:phage-related tail fiber protein